MSTSKEQLARAQKEEAKYRVIEGADKVEELLLKIGKVVDRCTADPQELGARLPRLIDQSLGVVQKLRHDVWALVNLDGKRPTPASAAPTFTPAQVKHAATGLSRLQRDYLVRLLGLTVRPLLDTSTKKIRKNAPKSASSNAVASRSWKELEVRGLIVRIKSNRGRTTHLQLTALGWHVAELLARNS